MMTVLLFKLCDLTDCYYSQDCKVLITISILLPNQWPMILEKKSCISNRWAKFMVWIILFEDGTDKTLLYSPVPVVGGYVVSEGKSY